AAAAEEAARVGPVGADRQHEARAADEAHGGAKRWQRPGRTAAIFGEAVAFDRVTEAVEEDGPVDAAEAVRRATRMVRDELELDVRVDELGAREAGLEIQERRRVGETKDGALACDGSRAV